QRRLVKNAPGLSTVTVGELDAPPKASPPAVGRTTVCTTSLTWSTIGTLSATNSIASRIARIVSVQPFCSQCQDGGSVMSEENRASSPTASSGMYALRPPQLATPTPVHASRTHPA